jgi:hypothetical protein
MNTEWKNVEAGVVQGSVLGPVLFLLFISDINHELPEGATIEKYADDIIAYIIGAAATTNLPQLVAEAVDRWCHKNGMRLNSSKCKVMHFAKTDKTTPYQSIQLDNIPLEPVTSYKYLGFEVNSTFDPKLQWERIQPLISKNTYLLNQLRSCGMNEQLLVTVFKSLVLSHFRYSSTILASCTAATNSEMQVLQNRLLRAIKINRETAERKYGILDVPDFIKACCISQVTSILDTTLHPLRNSLLSTSRTTSAFPFTIPRAKTDSFNNNAVMLTLRHLRDNVYGTGRSKTSRVLKTLAAPSIIVPTPPQPQQSEPRQGGIACPNPWCKNPTKNGQYYINLGSHTRFCKQPT